MINLNFIISFLLAGFPLLLIEGVDRKFSLKAENSRKLTHIFSSIVVCLLLFLIDLREISIIGFLYFGIMLASRKYKIWRSIYKVNRSTFGELWFPLAVGLTAMISDDEKVFIASILIMGLSDALAALVGTKYGGKVMKKINKKSAEGSLAFLLSAAVILFIVMDPISFYNLAIISIVLSFVEFFSPYGTDNITIPVIGSILLRLL